MNCSTAERGECDATGAHDEGQGYGSSFSTKAIRLAFIRKVYGILAVQLLLTLGIICVFAIPGVFLVTLLVLLFWEKSRRKTPYNYIGLMVFTIAMAFILGLLCSQFEASVVLMAVGVTALVCLSLTLFAFQTRIDFTLFNSLVFVFLIVVTLFGFTMIFWRTHLAYLGYSCLGVLLYSAYLIIDTQIIMGGGHRIEISSEEYILGALMLFLDMVMIFVYLLRIISAFK